MQSIRPQLQSGIHVVKLGGSLLDLPDLVARFEQWRSLELRGRALLVVGGGDAADAVRAFDARFNIGEEKSHWIAMRAMLFNAHLVAAVIRDARIVPTPDACEATWRDGQLAIIDAVAWMTVEANLRVPGGIPHRWSFTSDSISAHVAARLGATRLTLLKSTLPTIDGGEFDARTAGENGVVDSDFADTIRGATIGQSTTGELLYDVQIVNLRSEPWTRCTLR